MREEFDWERLAKVTHNDLAEDADGRRFSTNVGPAENKQTNKQREKSGLSGKEEREVEKETKTNSGRVQAWKSQGPKMLMMLRGLGVAAEENDKECELDLWNQHG